MYCGCTYVSDEFANIIWEGWMGWVQVVGSLF